MNKILEKIKKIPDGDIIDMKDLFLEEIPPKQLFDAIIELQGKLSSEDIFLYNDNKEWTQLTLFEKIEKFHNTKFIKMKKAPIIIELKKIHKPSGRKYKPGDCILERIWIQVDNCNFSHEITYECSGLFCVKESELPITSGFSSLLLKETELLLFDVFNLQKNINNITNSKNKTSNPKKLSKHFIDKSILTVYSDDFCSSESYLLENNDELLLDLCNTINYKNIHNALVKQSEEVTKDNRRPTRFYMNEDIFDLIKISKKERKLIQELKNQNITY